MYYDISTNIISQIKSKLSLIEVINRIKTIAREIVYIFQTNNQHDNIKYICNAYRLVDDNDILQISIGIVINYNTPNPIHITYHMTYDQVTHTLGYVLSDLESVLCSANTLASSHHKQISAELNNMYNKIVNAIKYTLQLIKPTNDSNEYSYNTITIETTEDDIVTTYTANYNVNVDEYILSLYKTQNDNKVLTVLNSEPLTTKTLYKLIVYSDVITINAHSSYNTIKLYQKSYDVV